MIWAIDPGNERSAYISLVEDGELNPQTACFGIVDNDWLLGYLREGVEDCDSVVIEMIASYGMPECLKALGFESIPHGAEEVKARFNTLVKQVHPDVGGTEEQFTAIQAAARQAIEFMAKTEHNG